MAAHLAQNRLDEFVYREERRRAQRQYQYSHVAETRQEGNFGHSLIPIVEKHHPSKRNASFLQSRGDIAALMARSSLSGTRGTTPGQHTGSGFCELGSSLGSEAAASC